MANRKKLGEILMEQGAAPLDALKRALLQQRQRGGRLGRILVERKAISEAQLARALAAQSRMPLAKMKPEIGASITGLVPLDLCKKHLAIAFGVRTANDVETVYVAIADPYDEPAMDEIRSHAGRAVKFALAPAGEIARAIGRASKDRELVLASAPAPTSAPPTPAVVAPAVAAPAVVAPAVVAPAVAAPAVVAPAVVAPAVVAPAVAAPAVAAPAVAAPAVAAPAVAAPAVAAPAVAPSPPALANAPEGFLPGHVAAANASADLDALLGVGARALAPPPNVPPAPATLDDLFGGPAPSGIAAASSEGAMDAFSRSSEAEASYSTGAGAMDPGVGMFGPSDATEVSASYSTGAGAMDPGVGMFGPSDATEVSASYSAGAGAMDPGVGMFGPSDATEVPASYSTGAGAMDPDMGMFGPSDATEVPASYSTGAGAMDPDMGMFGPSDATEVTASYPTGAGAMDLGVGMFGPSDATEVSASCSTDAGAMDPDMGMFGPSDATDSPSASLLAGSLGLASLDSRSQEPLASNSPARISIEREIPDPALPGIELSDRDVADELPPEASPWNEEASPSLFAVPETAGLSQHLTGRMPPGPRGSAAFPGLLRLENGQGQEVQSADPFSEPTRQIDLSQLSAQLRSAEDGLGLRVAGEIPQVQLPAMAEAPALHPGEGPDAVAAAVLDLFGADDTTSAQVAQVAPAQEPGSDEGWMEWDAAAPVPVDLPGFGAPEDVGSHAASAHAETPSSPALPSRAVLPDLASLRAELSAYSSEYGTSAAERTAAVAAEFAEALGGAEFGLGPLDLASALDAELGDAHSSPKVEPPLKPIAAPAGESMTSQAEADRSASAAVQEGPSVAEADIFSAALPPKPDRPPSLSAVELGRSELGSGAGSGPDPASTAVAAGEPVEISSDEIIDLGPESVGAPVPSEVKAPPAVVAGSPALLDGAAIAAFGEGLGSGTEPAAGAAPTEAAPPREPQETSAAQPESTPPAGLSPVQPLEPSSGAPEVPSSLVESLRCAAQGEQLPEGMAEHSSEQLERAIAQLLLSRGAMSESELNGVLALKATELSARLVRSLLAGGLLDTDDLIAMLTTPRERLNAAVLFRLIERGSVAPEEVQRWLS